MIMWMGGWHELKHQDQSKIYQETESRALESLSMWILNLPKKYNKSRVGQSCNNSVKFSRNGGV